MAFSVIEGKLQQVKMEEFKLYIWRARKEQEYSTSVGPECNIIPCMLREAEPTLIPKCNSPMSANSHLFMHFHVPFQIVSPTGGHISYAEIIP
ncbi:hypothetical protein GBA52_013587 [Prunus armeniaca]|nr:hypothetical protein GBA52_013587 [Prunus armeniaca]